MRLILAMGYLITCDDSYTIIVTHSLQSLWHFTSMVRSLSFFVSKFYNSVLYCFRQSVNSLISGKMSESLLCNNLEKFIKTSLAGAGIREETGWLHFAYIGIIFVCKGISHVSSIIFSFTLSKLLTH